MKRKGLSIGLYTVLKSQNTIALSKPVRTALFVWFAVVSVLITGYDHIYGMNHPYQLVLVQKLSDPALYPTDPFAEAAYGYAAPLWYIIAWLTKIVDLSIVLFLIYIVNKFLFLFVGFRLGQTFYPNSVYTPVVGLIVMATFPQLLFGNGYPTSDTNQTALCIGTLLLAFDAFLNRNWRNLALWFGLSVNLNLMFSIYAITYLAVSLLVLLRHNLFRHLWKLVVALVVGLVIGTPGILFVFRASTHKAHNPVAVWQACELAYGYHFYPQLWELPNQIATLLLAIIAVLVVYRFRPASPVGTHLVAWTLISFGWYLLAWINIFFIRSLILLHLHPVRALTLWQLATMVFLSAFVVYYAENTEVSGKRPLVLWTCAALLGLVIYLDKIIIRHILVTILVVLCVLACEIGRRILPLHINRSGAFLLTLALVLVVSISGPAISVGTMVVLKRNNFPAFQSITSVKVAEWARQNTPEEATFLIPLEPDQITGWGAFRHVSQRGVFTQWKDGSAWTYAPWFAEEWLARLKDLGFYEYAKLDEEQYTIGKWLYKSNHKFYYSLGDEAVMRLKKRYRIDYWITRSTINSRFPKVYEYEGWQVLKVSD